jgi:hypothetical protein
MTKKRKKLLVIRIRYVRAGGMLADEICSNSDL